VGQVPAVGGLPVVERTCGIGRRVDCGRSGAGWLPGGERWCHYHEWAVTVTGKPMGGRGLVLGIPQVAGVRCPDSGMG